MALAMQESFAPLRARWPKQGYDLDLGIGIAKGFATLGAFGFEGRFDYSAIGSVVNLAARLCAEALPGQILIDRRARAALDDDFVAEPTGPLSLKGYAQPVPAFLLKRATWSCRVRGEDVRDARRQLLRVRDVQELVRVRARWNAVRARR